MGILDGLNPEQLAAVKHDTGPQLVIAGAGTGKTQVITRRIAHLIAEGKAKPAQVLALTFTEKAAREMQERLYELIAWESFQVPVLTFNAFGQELLGRFASHIGRSVRGGLLNDIQKTLLLQQHIDRVELQYYGPQLDMYEFLEGIVGYIGQLQNAGVSSKDYSRYVAELRLNSSSMHPSEIEEQADLARLYTLYEELKVQAGAYDYSDQLALPLEILRRRPNLAQRLASEYRYVLVDEYQDTNGVQDALLHTFVGSDGNIFAVGDDDQAIYGFRGAEINNILAFSDHYKVAKPGVLIRNYRSGQAVLDAAYRLIQRNNPYRLEEKLGINKRLVALHDESIVTFDGYGTSADEQMGVLGDIERRIDAGELPASMAILASTHAPLKAMAKSMAQQGIPYAISTSVSIFDQPELLALWHLLKWLLWDASDEAVGHVIMGPFVRWTAEEYREILEMSRSELISVEEAVRRAGFDRTELLSTKLDQWRDWATELGVSQLAFKLVFETGLAEQWQQKSDDSTRMIKVFEDLYRLLEHMQDFETVAVAPGLSSYLAAFPKPPVLEISEPIGDAEGVQLLSVHAAKGLEFETVYLVNCTQRSWSAGRSMGRVVPPELRRTQELPPDHEFRRLMYVAVTRAKKALKLSAPGNTAGGSKQQLSPFIGEMLEPGFTLLDQSILKKQTNEISDVMTKLQRFYPMKDAFVANRLPFESQDGWLDLGVTALGGYDFCPYEFYIQHVLKITQPVGPQLGFGSALHRMFEIYYKSKMAGVAVKASELREELAGSWSVRGYSNLRESDADLELAQTTLARFIAREDGANRKIIGSEVPVRFEIPEAKLRLRGKIDALFEREDGFEIRDFKTGRNKTDSEKLSKAAKDNFQLRTYALACEQLRGLAPSAVVLDYVVTMVEGEAALSATILANHRGKLTVMADKIRQRDFAPNTSAMHECAAVRYFGTGEHDEQIELALKGLRDKNND